MLQMSVNNGHGAVPSHAFARTLAQLNEGESGVLDRLELPEDIARRLMELGFLPGHIIVPARSARAASRVSIASMVLKWRFVKRRHRGSFCGHPRRSRQRSRQRSR